MLQWAWADRNDLSVTWAGRSVAAVPGGPVIDITGDPQALSQVMERHDIILSLARAPISPEMADAMLATRLCAAAKDQAIPLFLCSSAAIYGDRPGPHAEDDAAIPVTPYGRGKLWMEQAAIDSGARVTCLRIGNVAGADALLGPHRPDSAARITLDVFPDGSTPRRSYIGPLTLAQVLADLMGLAVAKTRLPPTLNLAAPGDVSMADLLAAAGLDWSGQAAPPTALPRLTLDTKRLLRLVDLPPDAGTAPRLVREWQDYCKAAPQ